MCGGEKEERKVMRMGVESHTMSISDSCIATLQLNIISFLECRIYGYSRESNSQLEPFCRGRMAGKGDESQNMENGTKNSWGMS